MILTVLIFDVVLGFFTSVRTRSAVLRFMTWWLVPVFVTVLAIGPENFSLAGGESSMVWLAFAYFFMLGLVTTGVGSLLGYCVRRFYPKSFLVRPLPRAAQHEKESYQGRRCVACREPIGLEVALCPKCGWTQPA